MAHMIDMTNGRENFAYIGQKAWHQLGNLMQNGASVQEWTNAAGMEWEAVMSQVYVKTGDLFVAIPNRFALVRSDSGVELGSFTGRYKPVQPAEIMEYFRDFVLTDDRFTMETAGCLKGGAIIWALARFNDDSTVLGEKHARYVMLTTSFDGTRATTIQATMIRVVCNNTLTASIFSPRAANVRVSHIVKWTRSVAQQAHDDLQAVALTFDAYRDMAEHMATVRLSRHQTHDFLSRLIVKETAEEEQTARMKNQVAALLESYEKTVGEGTERGTAWAAFNAVTRYADHERSTRCTNGESVDNARMTSAFFGTGAQLKASAAKMLMEWETARTVSVPATMAQLVAA